MLNQHDLKWECVSNAMNVRQGRADKRAFMLSRGSLDEKKKESFDIFHPVLIRQQRRNIVKNRLEDGMIED